jgi:uncharacterized YigZ family protein
MTDLQIIPARHVEAEHSERNSRFIASGAPAMSVQAARDFIALIKDRYPDATHHVPAYIIGHGSSVTAHCSDDGEPSGTAGRPVLSVLKGSGLGDIVVVVTRYFGGTKLGTGGLVRAYSEAVRVLLNKLPIARKVATTTLMFVVAYSLYERTQLLIHDHLGQVRDEVFGADVTLTLRLSDDQVEPFKNRMIELTRGQVEFITLEHNPQTIMPVIK